MRSRLFLFLLPLAVFVMSVSSAAEAKAFMPEQNGFHFSVLPSEKKLFTIERGAEHRVKRLEQRLHALLAAIPEDHEAHRVISEWFQNVEKARSAAQEAFSQGNMEDAFSMIHVLKSQIGQGRKFLRYLTRLIEALDEADDEADDEAMPLPKVEKVEASLQRTAKQALLDLHEELRKWLSAVPKESYPTVEQYVNEWIEVAGNLFEKAQAMYNSGAIAEAEGLSRALKAHLQSGRQLLRKLQALAGQSTAAMPTSVESPTVAAPTTPPTSVISFAPEKFKREIEEPKEADVKRGLLMLEERISELETKLQNTVSQVSGEYVQEMKNHVLHWSDTSRNFFADVNTALLAGQTEKAHGLKKALFAHLNVGEQLLRKLQNMLSMEQRKEEPTSPGDTIEVYDKEWILKAVFEVEQRAKDLEALLSQAVALLQQDVQSDAAARVQSWAQFVEEQRSDVHQALADGAVEKAFGLLRAFQAHVAQGEKLFQKFRGAVTYRQQGESVKMAVAVNGYPQDPETRLAGAFVSMYAVKPVSEGVYEGTLFETKITGPNGEAAGFLVEPGQIVDFVAFRDNVRAEKAMTWTFSAPPYKNFSAEDGVGGRLCQINFLDSTTKMMLPDGRESCAVSAGMSYPVSE